MLSQQAGQLEQGLKQVEQGLQWLPESAPLKVLQQTLKQQLAEKQAASHIQQQFQQAQKYFLSEKLDKAYEIYQQILIDQPNHPLVQQALANMAKRYVQRIKETQSTSQRENLLQSALKKFPHQLELIDLQYHFEQKAKQQQQIQHLLALAEQHLAALRLTEPPGYNAYELYQQILTLVTDHPQARKGLKNIADRYEQLAKIERDDRAKNLRLIEKGLMVWPTHPGLRQLQRQFMAIPEPAITAVQPDAVDTVQELLSIAQQHKVANRLEAAYQTYKNILTLSPNQEAARLGLRQLADQYEQLAYHETQQGHWSQGLTLTQKGLAAMPNHTGLLTLQTTIQQQIDENKSVNQPEPTVPAESPKRLFLTPSF